MSWQPGTGRARGRGRGEPPIQPVQPGARDTVVPEARPRLLPPPPNIGLTRPVAPTLPLGRASDHYMSGTAESGFAMIGRGLIRSTDESEIANLPQRDSKVRGTLRGRREIENMMVTKPPNIETKHGINGEPVKLLANYFKLSHKPNWTIYKYRVDFKPDVAIRGLRDFLIRSLKDMLGGYLFDGSQIFAVRKLDEDITEKVVRARDDNDYLIKIKYTGIVSMSESTSLQILNLILRRAMGGLKLQLVGRNFFDPDAKKSIPDYKIELWPGYQTSIRQHEQDILLCSEITHKVMRAETLLDIIRKIQAEERDFKTAAQRKLLGQVVLTDYNNKTYRIDDIEFDQSPSDTFETKAGPVSYISYYRNKYNLTIKDPKQPLLISKAKLKDIRGGEKDTILLVPELCRATGLTDEMRTNFRLMKEMSIHTRVNPAGRIKKLLEFNRRLTVTPDSTKVLQDWDLQLEENLVSVPGRVLKNENIVFGNNRKEQTNIKFDWTPAFRKNSMYHVIDLKRWYVITTTRASREAREFVSCVITAGRGMRFEIKEPRIVEINDDRQHTYTECLDKCANDNPQLIMCVVPNNNADRYANIKKKCYVERAVASQVVVQKTITPRGGDSRGLMSIATKVAIQMNCKLGGLAWLIDIPIAGLMTFGFDVCHDARDKRKSYGALVATMDLKCSNKFFSAVSSHTNGEELTNELVQNINKAVREYRDTHGTLPARLVFYRDGVGDGQIPYVFEHEVTAVRKKLEDIYANAGSTEQPKMLFIVVSKRINTRIFTSSDNPTPGTVVDDIITLPEKYDFFLVSQCVREGTVSPTSYNVLYDTSGLPADKVQILTYKYTHLYYNWSGTVRVPAVCQYAHKLAFLIGQSINRAPSTQLERQLYFL